MTVDESIADALKQKKERTVVIVARHGERLDYSTRDEGGNWIPTTTTPWDPPLTEQGHKQGNALGETVSKLLQERGLAGVSAVYSSPFTRCRQTAVAAVNGLSANKSSIAVRLEQGLAESLNESWYRSWCVPGTNGSWGFRPKNADGTVVDFDLASIHPQAKLPVQSILLELEKDQSISGMDSDYSSDHKIKQNYMWGTFESQQDQRTRMHDMIERLAKAHPGETIMLFSHGGPVTHLYEELTGNHWSAHGESSYACYSVYEKEGEGWIPLLVNQNTSSSGRIKYV
jgi:broad specificity phosphatase PhoE|mmetsp:Transcript_11843/g.18333  ORF Transcript_11843/g.18333 Transcript_11843/m.18333 type:complete len:286 (+) Transcript_11843:38-895(+)